MSQSREDDKQFRRGVVLGLTFAEVLLLLIFVLMLILASRLLNQRREIEAQRDARVAAEGQLAQLLPLIQKAKLANGQPFDITKEWTALNDKLAKAQKELSDSAPAIALIARIKQTSPAKSSASIARDLEKNAIIGQDIRQAAQVIFPARDEQEAITSYKSAASLGSSLLSNPKDRNRALEAGQCRAELATCKAQNTNLSGLLGGIKPPCWADSSGRPQYIFDAHLKEDGIWLVDNHVPGRESEQSALPLSGFTFDRGVEANAFVSAGMALLELSKRQECRFYVRVFDETEAGSKARYKTLLNKGVEGIFFKVLAN